MGVCSSMTKLSVNIEVNKSLSGCYYVNALNTCTDSVAVPQLSDEYTVIVMKLSLMQLPNLEPDQHKFKSFLQQ